jgi:hypothetical protein
MSLIKNLTSLIYRDIAITLRIYIQYPFFNINVYVLIIYYFYIELISYNITKSVKYNHILLDVIL